MNETVRLLQAHHSSRSYKTDPISAETLSHYRVRTSCSDVHQQPRDIARGCAQCSQPRSHS